MGCNLHPAVKLRVPRALTTLVLDMMVPPEGLALIQSETAVMGWVLPADLSSEWGGNTSGGVPKRKRRGERLDMERCVQLGTALGCARLSGSPLARALGIVLALLSLRECNTIDGDST